MFNHCQRFPALAFACLAFHLPLAAEPLPASRSPDQILAGLGPTCFKSKTAAELDPLLAELRSLPKGNGSGSDFQNASDAEAALRFAEKWQVYLEFQEKGKKTSAYKILDEILEDRSWLSLVERSPVLEKSQTRYEVFYATIDADRLEDIDVAIEKLRELQRLADWNSNEELIQTLENFRELRRKDLPAKNWASISSACQPNPADIEMIIAFKQLLLAPAVMGYLKLDSDYKIEASSGESAVSVLDKTGVRAANEMDLRACWRLLTYSRQLTSLKTLWINQEIQGIDLCLQGLEKEKNRDISGASTLYRQVLLLAGSNLSLQVALRRISDIKKNFPEDFAVSNSAEPAPSRPNGFPFPGGPPFQAPPVSDRETPWEKY